MVQGYEGNQHPTLR